MKKEELNVEKKIKYFIPMCWEKGCEEFLKITIDEEQFYIKYIYEKNKDHKGKIFFETFERFYLKENFIQKCFNCSNCL